MRKSKVVGNIKDGAEDFKKLVSFLGGNPTYGVTVDGSGNYILAEVDPGYVLTESMGMWEDKYIESLADNRDIDKYKEAELSEKFPSNTISIAEYREDDDLGNIVDSLLANGLYLKVNKGTKCFELYYEW